MLHDGFLGLIPYNHKLKPTKIPNLKHKNFHINTIPCSASLILSYKVFTGFYSFTQYGFNIL